MSPSPPGTSSSPWGAGSDRMQPQHPPSRSRGAARRTYGRLVGLDAVVLGALLGGLAGGSVVVLVTLALKAGMDFVSSKDMWTIVLMPLLGLAITVVVLQVFGKRVPPPGSDQRTNPWRAVPPGAIRADISGDVVETAGEEEQFPWRLAPIRLIAILATVGSGGAMGTEAPAAYL